MTGSRDALGAAVLVVALAFAGCLGAAPDGSDAAPAEPDDPGSAADAPKDGGAEPEPDVVDPWGDRSNLTVFDGTVQAEPYCGRTFPPAVGCGNRSLGPNPVPIGTGTLRVTGDASQALAPGGSWSLRVTTNGGRTLFGETVDRSRHTWTFDLETADWDLPIQNRSGFHVAVWARLGVLQGPVDVTVAASRAPNWTAPNRSAIQASLDGPRTLLDTNETVENPAWAQASDRFPPRGEPVPLNASVPTTRGTLVAAVTWDSVSNCPPASSCRSAFELLHRDNGTEPRTEETGDGYVLKVYDVPADVRPPGPYRDETVTELSPWIEVCQGDAAGSCATRGPGRPTQATSADTRLVVQVWPGDADLDRVKARLGGG